MSIYHKTKSSLQRAFIKAFPDSMIHIESATRSDSKSLFSKLGKKITSYTVKNLKDWTAAVASASDPENPDFTLLDELYDNMDLDNHLESIIESRVLKVQLSKFVLTSENGDENPDLIKLLKKVWLTEFIKEALMHRFKGVSVIEVMNLNDNLELTSINVIPRQNVNPVKGIILKEPGDQNGWQFREGSLSRFYIQAGNNDEIGNYSKIAPIVLAKKLGFGSWLDFIEKFGIPPRWVTTDREDTNRLKELFDMMQDMVSNHFAVLRGSEKIEIAKTPNTDAYQTFDKLMARCNSEMSKRILGQDATTDNKDASGTYGSLKVLYEVANDRHDVDKIYIANIINEELIPRLIELSSFYSPLKGYTFAWDLSEEMSIVEIIDNVVKLSPHFDIDPDYILEKTGIPVEAKSSTNTDPIPAGKKKDQ